MTSRMPSSLAAWLLAGALVAGTLLPGAGCGRYGPPVRAPEFREDGRDVTPATAAMGRASERADEDTEATGEAGDQ